jgi:hypothetical protein
MGNPLTFLSCLGALFKLDEIERVENYKINTLSAADRKKYHAAAVVVTLLGASLQGCARGECNATQPRRHTPALPARAAPPLQSIRCS